MEMVFGGLWGCGWWLVVMGVSASGRWLPRLAVEVAAQAAE